MRWISRLLRASESYTEDGHLCHRLHFSSCVCVLWLWFHLHYFAQSEPHASSERRQGWPLLLCAGYQISYGAKGRCTGIRINTHKTVCHRSGVTENYFGACTKIDVWRSRHWANASRTTDRQGRRREPLCHFRIGIYPFFAMIPRSSVNISWSCE